MRVLKWCLAIFTLSACLSLLSAYLACPARAQDTGSMDAAPGHAAVSPAPDPDNDTTGFLKWSFNAIASGKFTVAASALVMLLVFLLRKFGGKVAPWLKTRTGGWILVTGCAALLELSHSWLAGASPGQGVLNAFLVLAGAVLGHTALSDAAEVKS